MVNKNLETAIHCCNIEFKIMNIWIQSEPVKTDSLALDIARELNKLYNIPYSEMYINVEFQAKFVKDNNCQPETAYLLSMFLDKNNELTITKI